MGPHNATQPTNSNMDHFIEKCSDIAAPARPARKIGITIIYENLVSAARALRACEFLRSGAAGGSSLDVNVWNMSILGEDAIRTQAASAASVADVVIISASAREGVPPAFRAWVDSWLWLNQNRRCALFALFGDHTGPAAVSMASYLRRQTLPRGIDFFCHPAIDERALSADPVFQPALAASPGTANDEWRPGADNAGTASARQTAFELVEEFAESLRSRLRTLKENAA